MELKAVASLIASVRVAFSTATLGVVLMVRGRVSTPSPLLLCAVAGLLVGISLLVVLPQATESLSGSGWKMEHVFIVFLIKPWHYSK